MDEVHIIFHAATNCPPVFDLVPRCLVMSSLAILALPVCPIVLLDFDFSGLNYISGCRYHSDITELRPTSVIETLHNGRSTVGWNQNYFPMKKT